MFLGQAQGLPVVGPGRVRGTGAAVGVAQVDVHGDGEPLVGERK
ncbi:hypothetical protein ABZ479_13810 [Streptomyces sp. NPDC005722]